MFLCGYLALGKRPYVGLLIGITLGVTMGAMPGDIETALWRSADVILGSLLALLFCSIYPQRAYSHWRLQLHQILQQSGRLYHTHLSPNVLERPRLKHNLSQLLAQTGKLRALLAPAAKETRHSVALFDAVQVTMRNTLCTLEMLANTYWNDRESHFLMQSSAALQACHLATEEAINQLALMMQTGDGRGADAAIARLHEVATQVSLPPNAEAAINGYLWLNVQLTEQLTHLRRLLGLILTPPHRKQPD